MNPITRLLNTAITKYQSYLRNSNAKPMPPEDIAKSLTSNNPLKIRRAARAIAHQSQNRHQILALIPYLSEIKTKTSAPNWPASILRRSRLVTFAIKTLEFHRDSPECPCSLYMEMQTFNPPQEEEKDNVKILNTVREPNRDIDYYVARCNKCGKVYEAFEKRHYGTSWNWKINVPDAWTFDYYLDFPSPDKSHRLIYDGHLCEVAMGGPLRGECFLETADKQRMKVHDTCGGPPLWETTGQFVAIPIWTEHKGQRLGVLNVTTRELTLYKDPVGGYHLHTGSFENNVIKIDSTKFDLRKKRIEGLIKLA